MEIFNQRKLQELGFQRRRLHSRGKLTSTKLSIADTCILFKTDFLYRISGFENELSFPGKHLVNEVTYPSIWSEVVGRYLQSDLVRGPFVHLLRHALCLFGQRKSFCQRLLQSTQTTLECLVPEI